MTQINVRAIKKKSDEPSKNELETAVSAFRDFGSGGGGTAIGAAVGGYFGGPAGAAGGAMTGNQIGQMVKNPEPVDPGYRQVQGVDAGSDTAINRRLAASREDRMATLNRAQSALQTMPKDVREEYAPYLVQATIAEEKRRAMGQPG